MIEEFLLEIAIFTFIMTAIGIGLTIIEFKKIVKNDQQAKKKKSTNTSKN